jgi:hypothetical protein
VAHTCSLSYSGGRDQEDYSSKPAQENTLQDPNPKKPKTKKGWWSGQGVGPEFKSQNHQKRERETLNVYIVSY